IRGRILVATGFVALVGAFAACASNDASIVVRQIVAPPQPQNGACVYTADPTQPLISSGTMDVGLIASYTPTILVSNQLIARADTNNVKAETARITLQGAVVHVSDTNNNEIKSFTSLGSGFIDPGTGGTPGYGAFGVTLIDPATAAAIAATLQPLESKRVVVRFTVFGQTSGGQNLDADEYQFPVDVCNGCLVAFPAGSQDEVLAAAEKKPNCKATSSSSSSGSTTIPCVIGQDQAVDCRLCQGKPACDPANLTQ
ncbi:MAG: hypothetical protein ABI551_00685, partial [Polyangiaceae bacterium]